MTTNPVPSTPAQVSYIKHLLNIKQLPTEKFPPGFDPETYDPSILTKRAAGVFIATLKWLPVRDPNQRLSETTLLTEGFYVLDKDIYKVQRAVHGSGRLYVKKLDPTTGKFHYARGERPRLELEAQPLTRELAQELGKLYGLCVRCGATLTDEDSIEFGMGPVCRTKF